MGEIVINIKSYLIVTILLCFIATGATSAKEPSDLTAAAFLPDLGNLSGLDNIFDVKTRYFQNESEKNEYKLYLFALAYRLDAMKDILTVSGVTRGIGNELGIKREFLTALPSSLDLNFEREKFPNLYESIDSIRDGNFKIRNARVGEITSALAQKACAVLDYIYKMKTEEIFEKSKIDESLREKVRLPIVIGYPGSVTVIPNPFKTTIEKKGYRGEINSVEERAQNYREWLDSISLDMLLYLPFYDENFFKELSNSVFSQTKPSYTFRELLAATIFYEAASKLGFNSRSQFAKWLYSGIDDLKEYEKLKGIVESGETKSIIDQVLQETRKPIELSIIAFKNAIRESIRIQNSSLDFLSRNQFASKEKDLTSCHFNPCQKYAGLTKSLGYLSQFPGLKNQFIKNYSAAGVISEDGANLFHHRLELAFEDSLKDKENRWTIPLRLGAITASIFAPGISIPLLMIGGAEIFITANTWNSANKASRETQVWLSLFDYDRSIDEFNLPSSSAIEDYRRFLTYKDTFKNEALQSTALLPLNIGLNYFASRAGNSVLSSRPMANLKEILKPTVLSLKPKRVAIALTAVVSLLSIDIIDAVGSENKGKTIFQDKLAKKALSDNSSYEIIEHKLTKALDLIASADLRGEDVIGLKEFLGPSINELGPEEWPVLPYDLGETRIINDKEGNPRIYINFEYILDNSASPKNLSFEIAYYFYLYRTANILSDASQLEDEKFRSAVKGLTGQAIDFEELQKGEALAQNVQGKIKNAVKNGIFDTAMNYAVKMDGERNPDRKYFGIGKLKGF